MHIYAENSLQTELFYDPNNFPGESNVESDAVAYVAFATVSYVKIY